jgi:hypothetical protein
MGVKNYSSRRFCFPRAFWLRLRLFIPRGRGGRSGTGGFGGPLGGGGTGGRASPLSALLIGYIKTGALKNNAASAVDKAAQRLTALGANLQGFVAHTLKNFKGMAAAFTFILIGRHGVFSSVIITILNITRTN